MPQLILVAGLNGTGKSTFLKRHIEQNNLSLEIINPDEVGGREALRLSKIFIYDQISFARETTLSGYTIQKLLDEARKASYKIYLIYLIVDLDECINRVNERVKKGGILYRLKI